MVTMAVVIPAANVDVMAQTNLFGTVAVAKTDERGEFDMPSADSNPALIATSNDGAFLGYFRAPQAEAERPAQPPRTEATFPSLDR